MADDPSKIDLIQEALRRGISPDTIRGSLPEEKRPLFDEAMNRGLLSPSAQPQADAPQSVPAPAQPQADAPQSGVGNFLASAAGSIVNPVSNLMLRAAGFSKEGMDFARQNPAIPYDPSRVSGILGTGAGMAAETLAGPVAPALFLGQGMEGATENIEQQAEQGKTAGAVGQIADVVGQGVLQYAMGKLAPGQRLSGKALGMLPELGSVAKNIAARAVAAAGITASEAELNNVASNALTKLSGVNSDQGLLDNSGSALLQGAIMGGAGQGAHDLISSLPSSRTVAAAPLPEQAAHAAQARDFAAELNSGLDFRSLTPEEQKMADRRMAGPEGKAFDGVDRRAAVGPPEPPFPLSEDQYQFENPPAESEHPTTLEGSKAVGDWYGKQFNDTAGAPFIESMASMNEGKYVLADVDPKQVDPSALQSGDKDQAKVDAIAAMTPEERAKLPPAIFTSIGDNLVTADGSHRLMAAQQAGDKSVRAYVPERLVGQNGVTAASETAPTPAAAAPDALPMTSESSKPAAPPTAFQQRLPSTAIDSKVAQWKTAIKGAWESANRLLGTGVGVGKQEAGVRTRLNATRSAIDIDRTRVEQALKPSRDLMNSWKPEAKVQWVEQIENGQPSTDPKLQPAADLIRKVNEAQKARAAKVGIDTRSWNPGNDWVGRLAEWPDDGTGNGTSLSGPETFRFRRDIETFGEFKKAVEDSGGRLKYDNPIEMYLAKAAEVNRSITGREFLTGEEKTFGTVKRFAGGQEKPETWEWLDDKLAADKGDEYAVHPKYAKMLNDQTLPVNERVANFRNLRDRVAGEPEEGEQAAPPPMIKLPRRTTKSPTIQEGGDLQSIQKTVTTGDGKDTPFPKGYTMADPLLSQVADAGRMAAPKPIADMLNQFIAPGLPKGSVFDRIAEVTRLATAVNFSLSAFHAATTGASNALLGVRQAMDNTLHGEYGLAGKNLYRAVNPVESIRWGSEVRKQLADAAHNPGMEPLAQAIRASGNRSGTKTILEPTEWQKAINAYRQGDRATAGLRFGKGVAGAVSDVIMEHLVPNAKVSALAMAAETATKRGLKGQELARYMQEASRITDNTAGQVVRSSQFQHRVVQNVMDLVMSAPKFAEGAVRIYGGATIDTLKGLANVALGKAPRLTANQQMVLAHLIVHGVTAATVQAIVSAAATGKAVLPDQFKDLWFPRTGRKNSDGSDERLSLPDPLNGVPSLLMEGPKRALTNRINPVWRALYDVASNSDYRNVMVREGNPIKQVGQSVAHVAKAALPWSVVQAAQADNPNQAKVTPGQRAAAFMGVRTASVRVSDSPAEQKTREIIANHYEVGSRTQEQADRSDEIAKLSRSVKNHEPGSYGKVNADVRSGKITPDDAALVTKRAQEPGGLAGLLKGSELKPEEMMQVWDEATAEEKRKIQWVVRSRIMNSETTTDANKRGYIQRIVKDVRSAT